MRLQYREPFAVKPTQTLPRFPTLAINLGEHTCCLYAFAPIPSTEWTPRNSFSDSLSRRTIWSKDVAVLGISLRGLPQFGLPLFLNL